MPCCSMRGRAVQAAKSARGLGCGRTAPAPGRLPRALHRSRRPADALAGALCTLPARTPIARAQRACSAPGSDSVASTAGRAACAGARRPHARRPTRRAGWRGCCCACARTATASCARWGRPAWRRRCTACAILRPGATRRPACPSARTTLRGPSYTRSGPCRFVPSSPHQRPCIM